MPNFPTCYKYYVLCFDARIKEEIERKAHVVVFAESEGAAVKKAKTLIVRKMYEVYEVQEIIDVYDKK